MICHCYETTVEPPGNKDTSVYSGTIPLETKIPLYIVETLYSNLPGNKDTSVEPHIQPPWKQGYFCI